MMDMDNEGDVPPIVLAELIRESKSLSTDRQKGLLLSESSPLRRRYIGKLHSSQGERESDGMAK